MHLLYFSMNIWQAWVCPSWKYVKKIMPSHFTIIYILSFHQFSKVGGFLKSPSRRVMTLQYRFGQSADVIFFLILLLWPRTFRANWANIMEVGAAFASKGDLQEWSWWRHQMEAFSALLAICAGNSPVPGEFPTQRPVTQSFDVYFDLRLNKRLCKQSWGWWFETLLCPLWRHRNVWPLSTCRFLPILSDVIQQSAKEQYKM